MQQPVELAQFVLQDDPAWTAERIRKEMEPAAEPLTVALRSPLPVLIAYSTTIVKQGRVYFFDDLYRHDALLERVLQGRKTGGKGNSRVPG